MLVVNIILLIILVSLALWTVYQSRQLKKAAILMTNSEFLAQMPQSQVIDIRDASAFRLKHILGARNIPENQIKQSLNALSKDRMILLYENGKPTQTSRVALMLKKQGFSQIGILQGGLNNWDGKVK